MRASGRTARAAGLSSDPGIVRARLVAQRYRASRYATSSADDLRASASNQKLRASSVSARAVGEDEKALAPDSTPLHGDGTPEVFAPSDVKLPLVSVLPTHCFHACNRRHFCSSCSLRAALAADSLACRGLHEA